MASAQEADSAEPIPPPQEAQTDPLQHAYIPTERLAWHVTDPTTAIEFAKVKLEEAQAANNAAAIAYHTRIIERLGTLQRDETLLLTLEEVVRRTLANNYTIEVFHYNSAIETTRVVEAESAFDVIFAGGASRNNIDRPTGSQLLATDLDVTTASAALRKLLPTGALVSGGYSLRRTKQAFEFQLVNPEYFSALTLELQQPLLRGFGLDFNRSVIVLARHDRALGQLGFRRQVRDTLRQVEEAYWRLMQARRDVVITAKLVAEFEDIYEYLVARRGFDITPVQIEASRADLELARADFISRRAAVFDTEDRMLTLMNDPNLNLIDHPELLPIDIPILQQLIVDPVSEVQTALEHRSEIQEQQLRVASAKVAAGRAKNAELPRVDLNFRVTYDGLASNADRSFDKMTAGNFIEYFVGVELEAPIGNRGPRASRRRADLTHAQARAQLQSVLEEVILDVNLAVRRMETSYDQIAPTFESAEAREREVDSIVARAERKDFNTLINELNSRQRLASTRRAMLSVMVDYNIAIIDLERAKGTLLEYNNVMIPTDVDMP
jgi:outer membrane protein TolC